MNDPADADPDAPSPTPPRGEPDRAPARTDVSTARRQDSTPAPARLGRFARLLLAALAVVLAHPPYGAWPLLFLAYPLFAPLVEGVTLRRAVLRGFLLGLAIEAGGTYWILPTIARFMTEAAVPTPGTLALGSIGFAIWSVGAALHWAIWGALLALPPSPDRCRLWWPAISLVAVNAFYPRIFPWDFGAAAVNALPLAQAAATVGTVGLTLLFAAISAAGTEAVRRFRSGQRTVAGRLAVGAIVALGAWWGWGAIRLGTEPTSETLRVGYVQPNVPLQVKHDGGRTVEVVEKMLAASHRLVERDRAQLVVWPEGMMYFAEREVEALGRAVRQIGVPIVAGLGFRDLNRAVLYDGREPTFETYDKRELLLFGERFPGTEWINAMLSGFGAPPIPTGRLAAGERILVSEIDGVPVGVSICYEGILEHTSFDLLEGGAKVHVNLTEDLWYGDSAAPHQHLALAHLRCIEAGLPLVRVTNGGFSAGYDALGRELGRTALGEEAYGVYAAPVEARTGAAPWVRAFIAYGCLGAGIALGFGFLRARRRSASKPSAPA